MALKNTDYDKKYSSNYGENGLGTDDYSKSLQNGGGSEEKAQPSATDDYYQLARDQEYGALFDKEVALENAKANALKYTQNQINAQGFGGTGYGSSLQGGIYNTYMNKVGEANEVYQENIKDINQQEKEAIEEENALRAGNISSLIQNSSSTQQMNNLLTEYGYGHVDEGTGEFVFNEKKPEGMTDDEWIQMKYLYNAQKDALDGDGYTGTYYSSASDFLNATFADMNGNATTMKQEFEYETNYLASKVNAGDVPYGSVVQMKNLRGDTIYVMYTKNGYRMANISDFNKANHQFILKYTGDGKSGAGNQWTKIE